MGSQNHSHSLRQTQINSYTKTAYGGINLQQQPNGGATSAGCFTSVSQQSMASLPTRMYARAPSYSQQQHAAAIAAAVGALAIGSEEQSQAMAVSQDGASVMRTDSLPQHLHVDVSRYPSQDFMCTPDYATPQDQQFQVEYDLAARPDQDSRSPGCSPVPVRNIKRTRRLAGLEENGEVNSQPSQSSGGPEASASLQTSSSQQGFSLPPVPSRPKSRFCRPASPASYKNPFLTGYDEDQVYGMDPRHPRPCPQLCRLHVEFVDIKEIGSGGFSRVLRATHRIDGFTYALKRTKHPVDTADAHNRWLQEVQALAAAQPHPNIIRYFNAWAEPDVSGDHLYIQMELAGETLADVLAAHKSAWREGELVGLMKQMASALAHLHERGIAHLDLKPDNIFRMSNGTYKLGDFGLATLSNGRWRVAEGDSRYLAPELLKGDVRHLEKADIFALGATLYELAAGKPLPPDTSVWSRVQGKQLPCFPGISNSFKDVIKGMLSEQPSSRPSATSLLETKLAAKQGLVLTPSSAQR